MNAFLPTSGFAQALDWSSATMEYLVDRTQRTILFWDVLRKRGNNYLAHLKAGQPPVLVFDYEMVVDGRTFDRPVNYSLVRILDRRRELDLHRRRRHRQRHPGRRDLRHELPWQHGRRRRWRWTPCIGCSTTRANPPSRPSPSRAWGSSKPSRRWPSRFSTSSAAAEPAPEPPQPRRHKGTKKI